MRNADVVRIMLADDHLLLRQVVREIVDREPDLEVVAEAGDGEAAVQQAAEAQPDVVLMDLSMPVCDGFQATQQILACSPHSRVVIFSASAEEQHVLRALQCGAIGYITKDASAEGLLTAIRPYAQIGDSKGHDGARARYSQIRARQKAEEQAPSPANRARTASAQSDSPGAAQPRDRPRTAHRRINGT